MNQDEPFRATISASNLFRRKLCPGSAAAEEGMSELKSEAAAEIGTMLHAMEADENLSREDLKAAQVRALEKNRLLTQTFIQVTFEREGLTYAEPIEYREREFFLNRWREIGGKKILEEVHPQIPGHADTIFYWPDYSLAVIADSKFGKHPVTRAELNAQLRCYAVMAYDDIGAKKIYCAIRQPYLCNPYDFTSCFYTEEDIEPARAEILKIVEECKKPDAPRTPTVDGCTFCKARGTPRCPESIQWLRSIRRARVLELKPAQLEEYGPEMAAAARTIDAWEQRMRQVATYYPALLKFYQLGQQQYTHHIASPTSAFNKLQELGKVETAADFMEACCTVSLPRLAAYLAKRDNTTPEDATDFLFRELGQRYEQEPVEGNPLIESKPKERALRRKPKQ